jgi:hypothetical protein
MNSIGASFSLEMDFVRIDSPRHPFVCWAFGYRRRRRLGQRAIVSEKKHRDSRVTGVFVRESV